MRRNLTALYAHRVDDRNKSAISQLFSGLNNTAFISFGGGAPDTASLPGDTFVELTKTALKKNGNAILQYGSTNGFLPLIQDVIDRLQRRQILVNSSQILISSGAQGALHNIAMLFLNKSDTILVENPTFVGALKTFGAFEANIVGVNMDNEGIQPDLLENMLKKHKTKFIYVIPNFHNPTGVTMSLQRRKKIASLADKYNTIILEDDPYFDLRYSGNDIPSIYSINPNRTIFVGSFSKIFSPSVRLGYIATNRSIIEQCVSLKQGIDLHSSLFNQALVHEFIVQRKLDNYILKIKGLYKTRLNCMSELLDCKLPEGFRFNKPKGGMYIWIEGPNDFKAVDFCEKMMRNKVSIMPGIYFYVHSIHGKNKFRLSFTSSDIDEIQRGVTKLCKLL